MLSCLLLPVRLSSCCLLMHLSLWFLHGPDDMCGWCGLWKFDPAAFVLYRTVLAICSEPAMKQEKLEQLMDCCVIPGEKRQPSNRWWKRRQWVILDIDWIECTDRYEHDLPMGWQKNVILSLKKKKDVLFVCESVEMPQCAWRSEQLLGIGSLLLVYWGWFSCLCLPSHHRSDIITIVVQSPQPALYMSSRIELRSWRSHGK